MIPGLLLLPIQPSLLDGWDHRTRSQGRGALWVIKSSLVFKEEQAAWEKLHPPVIDTRTLSEAGLYVDTKTI